METPLKVCAADTSVIRVGRSGIVQTVTRRSSERLEGLRRSKHLNRGLALGSFAFLSDLHRRIALTAVVVMAGFAASLYLPPSDFAQDYLAAAAVRAGMDPNIPSAQLAQRFGVPNHAVTSVRTAHPPLMTLIAMPYARLAWAGSRILWNLTLSLVTGVLLVLAQARCRDIALLAPAWIFGLALGNVDAIVVSLCLLGLSGRSRSVGLCLGSAAALKVYPVLLIFGLLAVRRYRQAVLSGAFGLIVTVAATLFLGVESLYGWLQFLPHNGDRFAVNMLNLSLTKFAGLFGWRTFLITLLGLVAVALQFRRRTIDPLLAAILLVSPLSWLQSLPLLTNRLTREELVACSLASLTIVLGWFSGVQWSVYPCVLASFVLTAIIARIYVRMYRESGAGAEPL